MYDDAIPAPGSRRNATVLLAAEALLTTSGTAVAPCPTYRCPTYRCPTYLCPTYLCPTYGPQATR